MPKNNKHPIPKKRFHGGRWRIYWKWNSKQYSLPTRFTDPKKSAAVDSDLRLISAALTMAEPIFPDAYAHLPAVRAYLADRYAESHDAPDSLLDPEKWLDDYERELEGECDDNWASVSIKRLRDFDDVIKGVGDAMPIEVIKRISEVMPKNTLKCIGNATPKIASLYLAAVIQKNSIATRNRTLFIFSRFYKWAIRTHRMRVNPVAGIKKLKEERTSDIVYCTPSERDEIIDLARQTGLPEWLSVPIAFFAGLRREEIANLYWEDVHLNNATIHVRKTKTRVPRDCPINGFLEPYLLAIPASQRKGKVVQFPKGRNPIYRLENLVDRIQSLKEAALLKEWGIIAPKPSRSVEYKQLKAQYKEQMASKEEELQEHLERIGWNPFRHTFGSLYAQGGATIDKISFWMGNSPEVCRRHYARFTPRDKRDPDIDKMM